MSFLYPRTRRQNNRWDNSPSENRRWDGGRGGGNWGGNQGGGGGGNNRWDNSDGGSRWNREDESPADWSKALPRNERLESYVPREAPPGVKLLLSRERSLGTGQCLGLCISAVAVFRVSRSSTQMYRSHPCTRRTFLSYN